jgi:hypothetical protein
MRNTAFFGIGEPIAGSRLAKGFEVPHPPATCEQDHGAGHPPAVDLTLDRRRDPLHTVGREAGMLRSNGRQALRPRDDGDKDHREERKQTDQCGTGSRADFFLRVVDHSDAR